MENLSKKNYFELTEQTDFLKKKLDEISTPYRNQLSEIKTIFVEYEAKAYGVAYYKHFMLQSGCNLKEYYYEKYREDNEHTLLKIYNKAKEKNNLTNIIESLFKSEFNYEREISKDGQLRKFYFDDVWFDEEKITVIYTYDLDDWCENFKCELTWDELLKNSEYYKNEIFQRTLCLVDAKEKSDEAFQKRIEENEKEEKERYLKLEAEYLRLKAKYEIE